MRLLSATLAMTALLMAACAPVDAGDPAPPPPGDGHGQCKADQYQRYIGRSRSELPARGEACYIYETVREANGTLIGAFGYDSCAGPRAPVS